MALTALNGGVGTIQSTSGFGAKYGELSEADAFTIQKKFLTISKKLVTMARFAQKETKPLHEGKDIRWRRYERFAVNTSTLSEGVTPESDTLQQTTIMATLAQYGRWVPITDVMMALSTDPIVQQITERQAIQMAETMDTLAYNAFKAGTNVKYSNGTTRAGVNTNIGGQTAYAAAAGSAQVIQSAVTALESKDAVKISNVVKAASEYNTEPVAEGFFAICHPNTRSDIENIVGFVPVEKYANYGAVMAGEIGKVGMARFIATTLATPLSGNSGGQVKGSLRASTDDPTLCEIYQTLIFAKDAVGCVSLSGKGAVTPTVVSPRASAEDPLGQRGSVGYQFWYVCKVLQDNWLVRIEHASVAI
jgi:N4-gp56 family major capsid protein